MAKLYWRDLTTGRWAYGDFREFEAVGGSREALGTCDPQEARRAFDRRLRELERLQYQSDGTIGRDVDGRLIMLAKVHLRMKMDAGGVTDAWLDQVTNHLETAIEFFGGDTHIVEVRPLDLKDYQRWLLRTRDGIGGKPLSAKTVRDYLWSFSNLVRRAIELDVVPPDYNNPVGSLLEKPEVVRKPARFLTQDQMALFLWGSLDYVRERSDRRDSLPWFFEYVASSALVGGRPSEIRALRIDDIKLNPGVVSISGTKTAHSVRPVPLFPQLQEILERYLSGPQAPYGDLLFPSFNRDGEEQPVTDLRKTLDSVSAHLGFSEPVRTRIFRHTYCAARLQCLDHGKPISPYTVSQELGHGGDQMVKRIYGHLGDFRPRQEAPEFLLREESIEPLKTGGRELKNTAYRLREWVGLTSADILDLVSRERLLS